MQGGQGGAEADRAVPLQPLMAELDAQVLPIRQAEAQVEQPVGKGEVVRVVAHVLLLGALNGVEQIGGVVQRPFAGRP